MRRLPLGALLGDSQKQRNLSHADGAAKSRSETSILMDVEKGHKSKLEAPPL